MDIVGFRWGQFVRSLFSLRAGGVVGGIAALGLVTSLVWIGGVGAQSGPPSVPEAPTVVASSDSELAVSWDEPADNGSPITVYNVRYRLTGAASTWIRLEPGSGSAKTATISGLDESTSYDVQVQAVNSEGHSDWSASGTATTDAAQSGVCGNGTVIPDHSSKSALVVDCEFLWSAKSSLIGSDGDTSALNWAEDRALTSWTGVTVAQDRVTKLILSKKGLAGVIPSGLGGLAKLTELILYSNDLSGVIPASLGGLNYLKKLHLFDNRLSGEIPSQLGSMSRLQELYLHENELSGAIPTELNHIILIKEMWFNDNYLSGRVSAQFRQKTTLKQFYLFDNSELIFPPNLESDPPIMPIVLSVSEDAQSNTDVGAPLSTSNGERYNLIYSEDDAFEVGSDGQIKVASAAVLDFTDGRSYAVVVERVAQDGSSKFVMVQVTETDQGALGVPTGWPAAPGTGQTKTPVIVNVNENTSQVRLLKRFNIVGRAFNWQLTGGDDKDSFSLSYSSSLTVLNFVDSVDYENPSDSNGDGTYEVTASITDVSGVTRVGSFEVTVDNVDEPPSVPEAPTVVASSDSELAVSWDEPANSGSPITAYNVRYRITGAASTWIRLEPGPGSATTVTIGSLDESTSYDVQVQAVNSEGRSDWSVSGTATTNDISVLPPLQTPVTVTEITPSVTTPTVTVKQFEDVAENSPHEDNINLMVSLDVIKGKTAAKFEPRAPVTRGQVASLVTRLWKISGRDCPADGTIDWVDAIASKAHGTNIACLGRMGILTGVSETLYGVRAPMTRSQVASVLTNLWLRAGKKCPVVESLPFGDVTEDSSYFSEVACIYGLGVTQGKTTTSYDPDSTVTRGQMASLLSRLWPKLQ